MTHEGSTAKPRLDLKFGHSLGLGRLALDIIASPDLRGGGTNGRQHPCPAVTNTLLWCHEDLVLADLEPGRFVGCAIKRVRSRSFASSRFHHSHSPGYRTAARLYRATRREGSHG